jgi:MFS family permease
VLTLSFIPGEVIIGLTIGSRSAVIYQMAGQLGFTGLESGLILGTLNIIAVTFGVFAGGLTDRVRVAVLFTIGMGLNAAANFVTSFAFDFWSVFITALSANLGVAIAIPSLTKILAGLFAERERGLALGLMAMTVRASAGLTLLLTPIFLLTGVSSWKLVFVVLGAIQAAIVIVIVIGFRISNLEAIKPNVERGSPMAKDFFHVLKIRKVVFTALAGFFLQGAQSFANFLPFLLQLTGYSAVLAGTTSSVYWVGGAIGAIIIPRLSDKVTSRGILLAMFCFPATAVALSLPSVWNNVGLSISILLGLGFVFAGLFEMTWLIPLSDPKVRVRYSGAATGVLFSVGSLGGVFANVVLGLLVDAFGKQISPYLTFLAMLSLSTALVSIPLWWSVRSRKTGIEDSIQTAENLSPPSS